MHLDQLRYFLEVAKYEHLSKAAKRLGRTPSAVSHSLASLQSELGCELFQKRGKNIFLTEHGRALVEKAAPLLASAESLVTEFSAHPLPLRGNYRLGGTHLLCSQFLTPAWITVQEKSVALTSEIYTLRSSQVVNAVLGGEIDFGICFNAQSQAEISIAVLRSGGLSIFLKQNHPIFSLPKNKQIAALSQYPAVLPKAFQGVDVCESHPVFEKFGIKVRPDCLIDSYEVALKKVGGSHSWSFLPDFMGDQARGTKALSLPRSWDATYQVCALWKKARLLPPALQQLLENLKQDFKVLLH